MLDSLPAFPQLHSIPLFTIVESITVVYSGSNFGAWSSWKEGLGGSHLTARDTGEPGSKRAKDKKWGILHWLRNSFWSLRKEFIPQASSGKLQIKWGERNLSLGFIYSILLTNIYWAHIRYQALCPQSTWRQDLHLGVAGDRYASCARQGKGASIEEPGLSAVGIQSRESSWRRRPFLREGHWLRRHLPESRSIPHTQQLPMLSLLWGFHTTPLLDLAQCPLILSIPIYLTRLWAPCCQVLSFICGACLNPHSSTQCLPFRIDIRLWILPLHREDSLSWALENKLDLDRWKR